MVRAGGPPAPAPRPPRPLPPIAPAPAAPSRAGEIRIWEVPADKVATVDSTGAGDAFCGALAAALAEGRTLVEAVQRAVAGERAGNYPRRRARGDADRGGTRGVPGVAIAKSPAAQWRASPRPAARDSVGAAQLRQ
jgi:hypothetical protein